MYKLFGLLNIALVVVLLSPFVARHINQGFIHSNSAGFGKLMKILRALHKPAALLLLASIVVHGWLALGALRLHTGTLAGAAFFITALLGLLFFLLHKAGLLKAHRAMALVAVLMTAVHLLFPWLIR